MRNLKKILALSLVFAMVFSLSFSAMAVDKKDFADAGDLDKLYEGSVDLLMALGAIKGKPDGSLDPKGIYTRAEMAYLTATIMLGGDIGAADLYKNRSFRDANGIATFSDVTDSDWFAGAVYYLAHVGVVSGDGGGQFLPGEPAPRLQVAAFALGIIGYKKDIQGYIGNAWSLNVQRDAAYCGLYTNISSTETNITREQVFQMMDNALNNNSIDYNPVTGQSFYPTDNNGENVKVLTVRYKMYESVTGLFTANAYASIDDSNPVAGRVVIGSKIIDNVADMSKASVLMLGREVRVYAKKTNIANRYEGILGGLVATDEMIKIGHGDAADDFDTHAARFDNGTTEVYENILTSDGTDYSVPANWVTKGSDVDDVTEIYAFRTIGKKEYNAVIRNTWTVAKVTDISDGNVTAVAFDDDDNTVIDAVSAKAFENGTDLKVDDIIMTIINDDDPVIAVPVASQKLTLSSVTANKVTLSGTVYTVIDSLLACTKYDEKSVGGALTADITEGENFGVAREYFIFTFPVTENERVVAFIGAESPDTTYCLVLDGVKGNLAYDTKVKVLMDDGTTGTYILDTFRNADNTKRTLGSFVSANQTSSGSSKQNNEIYMVSTTGNNTMLVMYEYTINGDKISLKEAKGIPATTTTTDVTTALVGTDTYAKGNSAIRDTSNIARAWLADGSRIFAYDGSDFYCFKGRTAPSTGDFGGFVADVSVFRNSAEADGGAVQYALFSYGNKIGASKVYGVLTTACTVTDVGGGKLQLSFSMLSLKDKTTASYKVVVSKQEADGDLVNGTSPTIGKGSVVRYDLNDDGDISKLEPAGNESAIDLITAATGSSLNGQNAEGWYELMVANAIDGTFFTVGDGLVSGVASTTSIISAQPEDRIYSDGDTVFVDLRDGVKSAGMGTMNGKVWAAGNSGSPVVGEYVWQVEVLCDAQDGLASKAQIVVIRKLIKVE